MDKHTKEMIISNLTKYYEEDLSLKNNERRIDERLKRVRAKNTIKLLKRNNIDIRNKTILDLGCGWGEFTKELLDAGAKKVVGIEPDRDRLEIAKNIMSSYGSKAVLKYGFGEEMEYKEKFDIIINYTVIEHTQEPYKVLHNCLRALKKKGVMFLLHPNYLVPYESHYNVFFPSFMPKKLAKIYLKLLKKNPNFVEELKYVTYWKTIRELKKNKDIFILKNLSKEYDNV